MMSDAFKICQVANSKNFAPANPAAWVMVHHPAAIVTGNTSAPTGARKEIIIRRKWRQKAMMKQEFDELVGMNTAPECYERIEFVYMHSNFFSDKQQIADFYKAYDMNGIERFYKEIIAYRDEAKKLKAEIVVLNAEIAACQKPVETAKITDELINDLAIFSELYIERIRIAIIQNADQIAKNSTIVHLLHEYVERTKKERFDYVREVTYAVNGSKEFRPSNNCLTHSSSYRDVLYDMLSPYWE